MNLELHSMALDLPPVARHPNRLPFRGVLTLVDTPSDSPPAGARGHRVLVTRAAAERALPSLLGMGLDYAASLDRHDVRRKVGIITEAEVRPPALATGNRQLATLTISGHLFARDFPDVIRELRQAARLLGMSYEIIEVRVADPRASIWTVTEFTFTGAAVLHRDKAAYRATWIELSPEFSTQSSAVSNQRVALGS